MRVPLAWPGKGDVFYVYSELWLWIILNIEARAYIYSIRNRLVYVNVIAKHRTPNACKWATEKVLDGEMKKLTSGFRKRAHLAKVEFELTGRFRFDLPPHFAQLCSRQCCQISSFPAGSSPPRSYRYRAWIWARASIYLYKCNWLVQILLESQNRYKIIGLKFNLTYIT